MFGYLSVFGDVTYPASRGGAVPARYERRSARWPRVRHFRWRRVRSSPEPGRPLGGRLGGYYSFPLFPNYHLGNEEKKTRRNRRERERREREKRRERREERERRASASEARAKNREKTRKKSRNKCEIPTAHDCSRIARASLALATLAHRVKYRCAATKIA